MADILDLKIFTNAINKYLDYLIRFYPLYLKSYEKFTFSMSAILDCKLRSLWAKSRVGYDCFEISIPQLPYKTLFMLSSLI